MRPLHADRLASMAERLTGAIPYLWTRWREQQEFAQFAQIDPTEAAVVARDFGLSTRDLIAISKRGTRRRDLLERRMRRLGLDLDQLKRAEPGVARDLTICCALCDSQLRCARDLRASSRDDDWRRYCINQQTLDALTALPRTIAKITAAWD